MSHLLGAANTGDLDMVKHCIEEDRIDVNYNQSWKFWVHRNCFTPLHHASRRGDLEMVRYLIEKGAHPNGFTTQQIVSMYKPITPLSLAAKHGHAEVVSYLLNNGAHVNGFPKLDYNRLDTPLSFAIDEGRYEAARELIKYKATLSCDGQSLLHRAVSSGNRSSVELLLSYGMDINDQSSWKRTALSHAMKIDAKDIFVFLLNKGADYNIRDSDSKNLPLMNGIKSLKSRLECMRILLEFIEAKESRVAMIDYVEDMDNYAGQTALHFACQEGAMDAVELLLEYGASPNTKDKNGRDAMSYLEDYEQRDELNLLLRRFDKTI